MMDQEGDASAPDATPVSINVGPIVEAVVEIAVEPYQRFVSRMLADGRVSKAEVDNLNTEIAERGKRLYELLMEKLPEEPLGPGSSKGSSGT